MTRSPNRKDTNRDATEHGGPSVTFSDDAWANLQKTGGITLSETMRIELKQATSQYSYDKSFYDESPTRKVLADELAACGKHVNALFHFLGINFDALTTERSQIATEIKMNMQGGEVAFAESYRHLANLKDAIDVTTKNFTRIASDDKGGRSGDLSLDRFLVALDNIYKLAGGEHAGTKASFILAVCEILPLEIKPNMSPNHETIAKAIRRARKNLEAAGHNPATGS